MPPMVTCSICKGKLLKSKTLHIGNGDRACKTHQGVEEQARYAQEELRKEADRKKEEQEERQRKFRLSITSSRNWTSEEIKQDLWKNYECWLCGEKGVHLQVWYQRIMIAHELVKISGNEISLEDYMLSDGVLQDAEIADLLPINRITLPADASSRQAIIDTICKKDRYLRTAIEISGFVQSCTVCAAQHSLNFSPEIPLATTDKLLKMSSLFESIKQPEIQSIASDEANRIVEELKNNKQETIFK